jgi:hypothetical protein
MRLLPFIFALPLGASAIINSTSVQTTCHWIGNAPSQPDITLTDSSGIGSSAVSCPVNYVGPSASASSTASGADAIATVQMGGIGIGDGQAHASAGFEVSGAAPQDGSLPLDFLTFWRLLQDGSTTQMEVTFYFNGVRIGGFSDHNIQHDTGPREHMDDFVEPVHAGEAYTFGVQAVAAVAGAYFSKASVEVQTAVPEPATTGLFGLVCLGSCIRARKIR